MVNASHRFRQPGILLLVLAMCLPVLAQEPPAPAVTAIREADPGEIYVMPRAVDHPDRTRARAGLRSRVDQLWRQRKEQIRGSDEADHGPESLASLRENLQRQGYRSVCGMGTNLIFEAYKLKGEKRFEQAGRSLEAALALEPHSPAARAAQAEIALDRRPVKAPARAIAAIGALTDSFRPAVSTLINLSLLTVFSLALLAVLVQVTILARHQRRYRHSFLESWRERVPGPLVQLLGWLTLFLPLFVFLGPFWLFCCWTALLWRFAGRRERLLAVTALVILALAVPAADTVVDTYRDLNSGDLRLIGDALEERMLSPRGEALLREGAEEEDQAGPLRFATERRFLVASIYQRQGKDDDAFKQYESIPVYHHLYPMARNNMGNIYFAMNQFDLAIQHYRKAIDLWPEYAECYFNLSSAQFQVYDFDHSDQSLSRAQRLDPLGIGRLINDESRGQKTLDHRIPESFLWELAGHALRHNASDHFAGLRLLIPGGPAGGRGRSLLVLLAGALLSVLLGLLLSWYNRHEAIGCCRSCGRPWCRLCGPDPLKDDTCQQCSHLGSRMSGVSPEIRSKKLKQIRRHQVWEKLRGLALTICIPGLERLRQGKPLSGSLLAWLWIFLVFLILALPGLLPPVGIQWQPWRLNPLVSLAGLLAASIWCLNLVVWAIQLIRGGGWKTMDTLRPASGKRAVAGRGGRG